MLRAAFAGRGVFLFPDTLGLDGCLSRFHHWRHLRSIRRNLCAHYGVSHLPHALRIINAQAKPGDLISGGHIDYEFARRNFSLPVKMITLLRHPVARSVSEYNYARHGHLRRGFFQRVDSMLQAKMAARYSLTGYLDWLLEHRLVYGNIASRMLGWDGEAPLGLFFAAHVFHAGVLEQYENFAAGLSEKLAVKPEFAWENRTSVRAVGVADADARRRIERLYDMDFELYEHVRALPMAGRVPVMAASRKVLWGAEPDHHRMLNNPLHFPDVTAHIGRIA